MAKMATKAFLSIALGATGGVVLYLAQKKMAKKKSNSYAEASYLR